MAIIQISKIQQRSGNLVDLPQLDEAEFGWASDAKRLFIGKTTPNENIEVLTSYSQINYSQLNGSVGNLNISNVTVADGQVLTFDGNNWVNRGGDAGGLITLGDASNVKITGGAIGYVLETDGLGNLSWTPKSTVIAFIQNVTTANPAVVTTTQDNFFTDGAEITITNAAGMTDLNGNTYYANVLTSNTFSLYSDPSLTTPVNSIAFTNNTYSYTTATSTSASTNRVTIGNSAVFNLNQEVLFLGDLSTSGLENNVSYYIKAKPSGTTITVSEELLANGVAGNIKVLATATLTGANVYATGGRAIASVSSGGGGSGAAGSNTTVQFNNSNLLDGDADFTWNFGASPKVLGIVGNANVGNLNASGIVTSTQMISNIATGTAPLTVTSTTRVANLNVSYANVSDFGVVTAQTTGTFFPVFVNSSSTGNRALAANANLSFNAATGALSATLLAGTLTTAAQPNITSVGTLTTLAVSGTTGVVSTDSSAAASITKIIRAVNGTQDIALIPRAGAGSYNTLTAADDTLITFGNSSAIGNANLTIAPWASGNTGIRIQSVSNTATIFLNATNTNVSAALNVAGTITAPAFTANTGVFTGNGSGLSALNASNISTGTLAQARLANASVTLGSTALTLGSTVTTVDGLSSVTSTTFVGSLSGAATTAGTVTTAAQPNITSVGTLTSLGVSGNITAANITANTGVFTGNGSGLSAIAGANVTGTVSSATTAGTVTTAAQPNITSTGTLSSLTVSGKTSMTSTSNALEIGGYTQIGGASSAVGIRFTGGGTLYGLALQPTVDVTNLMTFFNAASTPVGSITQTASNVTFNGLVAGANVTGTVSSATSATTAGTVTTAAQPNITSVGTLTSLNVSGALTTTNITAGANTTAGTITGNWTLTSGSRLQATYADLAEYYEADDIYTPGTVLMFGGEKEVSLAEDETNRVAGVVSTNPAYVMNSTCPGLLTAIALQGRVPCKVRGKITKGDMLVSAGSGFAKSNMSPSIGTVIGKALQDFDGHEGIIEVAVGRL
jgi:hypothetical protein